MCLNDYIGHPLDKDGYIPTGSLRLRELPCVDLADGLLEGRIYRQGINELFSGLFRDKLGLRSSSKYNQQPTCGLPVVGRASMHLEVFIKGGWLPELGYPARWVGIEPVKPLD